MNPQNINDLKRPILPKASSLLVPSWNSIKLNSITFIEFAIIPIMFSLLSYLILKHTGHQVSSTISNPTASNIYKSLYQSFIDQYKGANAIVNGIGFVAQVLLAPGLTITLLEGAKNNKIDFMKAFTSGLHFLVRYILIMIYTYLLIIIGFILFIVPGLFLLKRYILAPYYLVDRDCSVREALKKCTTDSKKFSKDIWGVIGFTALFGLLFIIPIIGWLPSIVLSIMYYNAPAIRYVQIRQATLNSELTIKD